MKIIVDEAGEIIAKATVHALKGLTKFQVLPLQLLAVCLRTLVKPKGPPK